MKYISNISNNYLDGVDFINFALGKFYVQCLYASFSDHEPANLTNKFIAWKQYAKLSKHKDPFTKIDGSAVKELLGKMTAIS